MRVKIKDYQIIENADLEFDVGITAIVGVTNSGKSSIIRAIQGAVNNQAGTGFINYNADESRVIIEDGDTTIEWIKHKTKPARYILNGNEIEKIGRTQNEEVAALLNVPEIDVGSTKVRLNFWDQMEKAFLMDKSPGQLFSFISQSKEQEVIMDYSKQKADSYKVNNTELNTTKTQIDIINSDIEKFEAELAELGIYNTFDIETIEKLQSIKEKLEVSYDKYLRLKEEVDTLTNQQQVLVLKIDPLSKKLEEISKYLELLNIIDSSYHRYNNLKYDIKQLDTMCSTLSKEIKLKTLQIQQLSDIISEHSVLVKSKVDILESLNKYKEAESSVLKLSNQITDLNNAIKGLEEELLEFDVCPYCGSNLNESHVH